MAVQQITELATTHMTLGAHNKFNIDVNNAIIQATAAALRVENYATLYAQKIEEESRIVNRQTAMASTVDVSAADRQRDRAVGVIMNLTNAHTTSIIAEKADAANKLRQLLAPYKGIGAHAYQKETAEINGMVAVLTTGDGATYAATLGLDDEVDALVDQDRIEKEQTETTRIEDIYGRGSVTTKGHVKKHHIYLFTPETLDDDNIIFNLEESPTYTRDKAALKRIAAQQPEKAEQATPSAASAQQGGTISF